MCMVPLGSCGDFTGRPENNLAVLTSILRRQNPEWTLPVAKPEAAEWLKTLGLPDFGGEFREVMDEVGVETDGLDGDDLLALMELAVEKRRADVNAMASASISAMARASK